jgi:hypothetical protein
MRHWLASIGSFCLYAQCNVEINVPAAWELTEVFSLSDIPLHCNNRPTEELE